MSLRCALVVIVALGLGTTAGCTGATSHNGTTPTSTSPTTTTTASSTTTPSSTTSTSNEAEQNLQSAKRVVRDFWTVIDKLSADPKAKLDGLATVSRSPSIGVWRQIITKQRIDGQVQTGTSKVVSATAEKSAARKFDVTACIDVSKVNLVDKNGRSVVSANRLPRVKYQYVITKGTDGRFYVTNDKAISGCSDG